MQSEKEFIEALRRGDEDAYEKLMGDFGPRLLSVARRLLGREEEARDAVQEGFIKAFKAMGEFRGEARLSTWLHRIVVNAALMKRRSRKARPEESIETFLPAFLEDGHQANPAKPWPLSADQLLERKEVKKLVRESIDRLPDAFRSVLILRDMQGFSTRETAQIHNVSENAVKIRLHRARQALREIIDPLVREVST